MKAKIYALIPIKYNSSRVPGKNFKFLHGKPLFYYIIKTLINCKYINKIIVNIDNEKTEQEIKKYFNDIIYYYRPSNLIGDEISTNKLFLDMINKLNLDADIYLQTHTTNPLLSTSTIKNIIDFYLSNQVKYDTLFTVNTWQTRLYKKNGSSINHNCKELIPTQDLDPIYEENSCLYLFTKKSIEKYQHRIGGRVFLYPISRCESTDIDTLDDWKLAEFYLGEKINENKRVLITGVSGGIGTAIAKYFKIKKWQVIGIDINNNDKGICDKFYQLDITKEENIIMLSKEILKLDCLVNNAAIQICKPFAESSVEDWDKIYNCNVKGAFMLSKYFYPQLKQSKGNIVNISSVHAVCTSNNISLYASSKGSLSALTRAMALDYGKDGIRVNAILPGAVDTPMLRAGLKRDHVGDGTIEDRKKKLDKKHIMGKMGEPMEIAKVVYFLGDNNQSSYIVGENIVVDGGATIRLSTE